METATSVETETDGDRLAQLRAAIEENQVPGGSAFGRAAAEVIALSLGRADAAGEDPGSVLSETSHWLVGTKPSMTSVRTASRIAEQTWRNTGSTAEVIEAMYGFIADSEASVARIGQHADKLIADGARVLFHSYSASLIALLARAANIRTGLTYIFTESRPYRESRRIVQRLADSSVGFIGVSDAAMAVAVENADLVVVGADALFRDGSFANKVGSLPLALSCRHLDKPYYVVSELSKLYPGEPADVVMELRPAAELADDWELWRSGRVEIANQFFERVPGDLVTAYLTDDGSLDPSQLADRLT